MFKWVSQLGKAKGGSWATGHDTCQALGMNSNGEVTCAVISYDTSTWINPEILVAKLKPSGEVIDVSSKNLPAKSLSVFYHCNSLDTDSFGNFYCGGETTGDFGEKNGNANPPIISASPPTMGDALVWRL